MTDEHGKAITFLSLREKGVLEKVPNNMTAVLHACFVKSYFFYVKVRLCMSKTRVSAALHHAPQSYIVKKTVDTIVSIE